LAKKISNKKNVIITTRNIQKAKKKIKYTKNVKLIKLNVLNKKQILNILLKYKPTIIFYFAGQSSPKISFLKKDETTKSNYVGCKNFLEIIYTKKFNTQFLNASGIAKLKSYQITKFYRVSKKLKAYNAIIFNTESKYRDINFLIPKICLAAIRAKKYRKKRHLVT